MMKVKIGQVLALRLPFDTSRENISETKHPYLIVRMIDNDTLEVAQLDSLQGKEWKALWKSNHVIYATEPTETVIDKHSYVRLDTTIQLEYFDGIIRFRRQEAKLSPAKLALVIQKYNNYHKENRINEEKQIYVSKEETLDYNS